jgi:hypothetical protein
MAGAMLLPAGGGHDDCPICCARYTAARRAPVACPACAGAACRQCHAAFLLTRAQACCLHCAAPWNREFVDASFPGAFRNGALKQRRQEALLAVEEAMLPATQWYARMERRRRRVLERRARVDASILRWGAVINRARLQRQLAAAATAAAGAAAGGAGGGGGRHGGEEDHLVQDQDQVLRQAWAAYGRLMAARQRANAHLRRLARLVEAGEPEEANDAEPPGGGGGGPQLPARRAFVRRCPRDGCPGFLTTRYKCGMCHGSACPSCLEPLERPLSSLSQPPPARRDQDDNNCTRDPLNIPRPNTANHTNPDESAPAPDKPPPAHEDHQGCSSAHACDPATVASVQAILRDARPCPQCGIHIHKIDGCDQMWCTGCRTAFSWATGRVETGRVHNPHWYEWQRRVHAGGDIPREPGDVPGGGGGGCALDDDGELVPYWDEVLFVKGSDDIFSLHRTLHHVRDAVLPRLRQARGDPHQRREDRNRDLRVRFLLGDIDRGAWQRLLYAREKRRDHDAALHQALEMFVHASSDILWRLRRDAAFTAEHAMPQLLELRRYANECLLDVSRRFGSRRVLRVTWAWDLHGI